MNPADIDTIAKITGDYGTAMVINNVDHLLRTETAAISNPKRYKQQATEPIDDRVVDAIVTWLGSTAINGSGGTDAI